MPVSWIDGQFGHNYNNFAKTKQGGGGHMKKPKNPVEREKEMEQEQHLMQSMNESYQSGIKKKDKR